MGLKRTRSNRTGRKIVLGEPCGSVSSGSVLSRCLLWQNKVSSHETPSGTPNP
jgi:hypothetical protein